MIANTSFLIKSQPACYQDGNGALNPLPEPTTSNESVSSGWHYLLHISLSRLTLFIASTYGRKARYYGRQGYRKGSPQKGFPALALRGGVSIIERPG